MTNKTPPNSQEAEINVLASLIIDPTAYHLISGLITEDKFYTTKHQQIYRAIAQLVKDDTPVDLTTLNNILGGEVEPHILATIAGNISTAANVEYHAKIVAEKHLARQAIYSMSRAVTSIQEPGADILSVISDVQKELDHSLPQRRGNSDLYPAIIETLEKLIDLPKGGEKNFLPTGFARLDRQVRLTKGTLTLIAADAGTGKTAYLLSVMRQLAREKYRPVMFTLEMTRRQIEENIIAQELDLCHRDMIAGYLSQADQDRLLAGLTKFSDLKMGIHSGRWTVNEIRHQMITEMRTKGADCLLIDSMGKVKLPAGMSKVGGKVHDIYNYICEELVDVAEELDIPVVLTHHLNKDGSKRGKKNRPTVGSLREAGDMWTHNVILIYREYLFTHDPDVKDHAEFIIVKARDGEVGIVPLGFNGPSKYFYNIEEHREPPETMGGAKHWEG
jgi:replicative DNA helicase